jgi:hypothetical protein
MPVPFSAEMKWKRAKVRKIHLAVQFPLDLFALVVVQAVPLVDGHHQGAAGLQDEAGQVGVLVGDFLAGVQHQDHHVGVLDGLQGLDHRELLDGFVTRPLRRTPAVSMRV